MMQKLKEIDAEEKTKMETEKITKARIQKSLAETYSMQENMRKKEKEKEHELDKVYLELYGKKLNDDEKNRQRVFFV